MEEFKVACSAVSRISADIQGYTRDIHDGREQVISVKSRLRRKIVCEDQLGARLDKIASSLEEIESSTAKMGGHLNSILLSYLKTEKVITQSYLTHTLNPDGTTETSINSNVFDGSGAYGGDQGDAANLDTDSQEWKDLAGIIRSYYPGKSDEEIEEFLKKMNSEGCGYVAVINTIFAAYDGREAEFERIFGFPMYRDGDLDFNRLLVDFYCKTDNHNRGADGRDVYNKDEDYGGFGEDGFKFWYNWFGREHDTSGRGSSPADREYRLQMYLEEKGVHVDAAPRDVTPDNFTDVSKEGYVEMSLRNGTLYDEAGRPHSYEGGHAMIVTGVTSDGRFIVSSWGKKYYVDPKDFGNEGTTVRYQCYTY